MTAAKIGAGQAALGTTTAGPSAPGAGRIARERRAARDRRTTSRMVEVAVTMTGRSAPSTVQVPGIRTRPNRSTESTQAESDDLRDRGRRATGATVRAFRFVGRVQDTPAVSERRPGRVGIDGTASTADPAPASAAHRALVTRADRGVAVTRRVPNGRAGAPETRRATAARA